MHICILLGFYIPFAMHSRIIHAKIDFMSASLAKLELEILNLNYNLFCILKKDLLEQKKKYDVAKCIRLVGKLSHYLINT